MLPADWSEWWPTARGSQRKAALMLAAVDRLKAGQNLGDPGLDDRFTDLAAMSWAELPESAREALKGAAL